jgi:DNA-binding beta-propeller fold protein YncE
VAENFVALSPQIFDQVMDYLLLWTILHLLHFLSEAFLANVSLITPDIIYNNPTGVIISPDGYYALIADQGNHIIRKIILSTSTVVTFAGLSGFPGRDDGFGSNARFDLPLSICISSDGQYAYVADYSNHLIRKIIISTSFVSTTAGVGQIFGYSDGVGTFAMFYFPTDVTLSSDMNFALVADGSNHLIRHITLTNNHVQTLVGRSGVTGNSNGFGSNAKFNTPNSISISPDNSLALVADYSNHLIRQIIISTSEVITLAGGNSFGSSNGLGTHSRFYYPSGVEITSDGLYAFISDRYNHLLRQIHMPTGIVSTIAGMNELSGTSNGIGTQARFTYPYDISVSSDLKFGLIADSSNNMIRSFQILQNPTLQPTSPPTHRPTLSPTLVSSEPTTQPSIRPTQLSLNLKRQRHRQSATNRSSKSSLPITLLWISGIFLTLGAVSYGVSRRFPAAFSFLPPWSGDGHHHRQSHEEGSDSDSTHSLYKPEDGIQMSMSPVNYSIVPTFPESP